MQKKRDRGASLAGQSRSGSVTDRNETKISSPHQMPEARRRNLKAAFPLAYPKNPCNEPLLLPVTQFNLNTSIVSTYGFRSERFDDVVCDRDELDGVLVNVRKQYQNAKSAFS